MAEPPGDLHQWYDWDDWGCPNTCKPPASRTSEAHTLVAFTQIDATAVENLQSSEHLAVVELDFLVSPALSDRKDAPKRGRLWAQTETGLKVWKRDVVKVLRGSPSKKRKLLRWKVYETQTRQDLHRGILVEEVEVEVLPGALS